MTPFRMSLRAASFAISVSLALAACAEAGGGGAGGGGGGGGSGGGGGGSGGGGGGAVVDNGGVVFPPRADASVGHPLDHVLRLNHIQMEGTHNSFHVRPTPLLSSEWDYEHQPLDVQLESQGVRAVELDVFWNWTVGRFEVYHVYLVDDETTCKRFTDCLATLRLWSDAHPAHHPIFIQIEPKGEGADSIDRMDELEAEILSVLPMEMIITPDEVRGGATTLREAVTTTGWPTLAQTRGRMLFFLNCSRELCLAYANDGQSLDGRLAFVDSDADDPFAAVRILNTPGDAVQEAVEHGFIVRTRALSVSDAQDEDDSSIAVALASGGHIISTDVPAEVEEYSLHLEIPGGTPSRCNPITAPEECTSLDVEDPALLGP